MGMFEQLITGFHAVIQPINLLLCFVGVFIGTLIGVLPGLGRSGTMAILFPITFGLPPVSAIILLAGIYYGAQYGGSTTAILVNIPGETSSVMTCLDGYQMARQGRAGPALGISALGSFIGGSITLLALMFIATPLARAALKFGPADYFALMCMGLVLVIYLARGSISKAIIMALVGLFLGTVGIELASGTPRFTFKLLTLSDGIGMVPLIMGIFGIAEVLTNLEGPLERVIFKTQIKNLLPNLEDWKRSTGPIIRASIIGFFLGLLPGGGAILPTFVSYTIEKKLSKHPEEFGRGAIEGVAGPETANNAGAGGSLVPLFALGLPPNPSLAILLGALMVHGVAPGPKFIIEHGDIFWGVIASMYMGNVMLLILNLPLIGLWVKVLKVPYWILMPLIIIFCVIGCYSLNSSKWDLFIMTIFGIVGYLLRKFGYEEAVLVLAFILGPMLELNFRQALIVSDGRLTAFLERPFSAAALAISALLLISSGFSYYRRSKSGSLQ